MNDYITIITESHIYNGELSKYSPEYSFWKRVENATDYIFDYFINSDEWILEKEYPAKSDNRIHVFKLRKKKNERVLRVLYLTTVEEDNELIERLKPIEYRDA